MRDEVRLMALAETTVYDINLLIQKDTRAVIGLLQNTGRSFYMVEKELKGYIVELLIKQIKEGVRC